MGSATNALMRLVRAPANYWAGMLLDAGIAVWLLVHAARVPQRPWMIGGTVLFLGGLCPYSLVEYVVHRWFYHHPLSPGAFGHRLHHSNPQAPIALPCCVTAIVELGLWGALRPTLGDGEASVLVAALVIGFVFYGLLHHAPHHQRLSWRYLRILRGHHRIHHEFPAKNYGVTATVWDWVFGTHYLLTKPSRGYR
jgi:sterol desaturase/sphingolipid hydroxylase (fatty acid hydroxylase superfamily)